MDELHIEKIDLSKHAIIQKSTSEPNTTMARKPKWKKLLTSRKAKIIFAVCAVFILCGIYVGFKSYTIYNDANRTYAQAKVVMDAARQQNIIVAKQELIKTKAELATLKKDVDSLMPIGWIPFLGAYYNDGRHMINAGTYGIDAAIITAESLEPYADVLGLKGEGSFAGSAQDRIRVAVKSLGKVVPRIDDIEQKMLSAKEEIDKVDPTRYPRVGKLTQVRDQIETIKVATDQGVSAVEDGKPLIKVLPKLLGEDEARNYLILFQNDKELRPTGGFLTYYAIFKVEQGVVSVDTSSNIYDLDDSIRSHPKAPYIIDNYLPKVDRWYIRDTNLSPDFQESMKKFNEFYEDSSAYKEVDGIIAIDTHFLVDVLDVLGEVQASGLTFHSKNDDRCDCPQVVYALENEITRPVNYVKSDRKALLGDLLFATMQKALSSSPKEYWGRLVQAGMSNANDKHILFYLYDKGAQQGIEALNWGGRIRAFEGDYLHINDANLGGAKSNLFVRHKVKINYELKNNVIQKTVTLNYRNPYKYSNCNLEAGGLCLNAILRNFQRVYVPEGSKLVNAKGAGKVLVKEELGKTYLEGFFYVYPEGASTVTYTYTLPFTVEKGEDLPVLIQKQPGTYDTPYEISVNGKTVESFDLTSDKQLLISL